MKTSIKMTPVDMEARKKIEFSSGDTVRVWTKIADEKNKGKFRLQAFEGMVLARKHGTQAGGTFTVRKIASGVGVERIFPIFSPMIDSIEVTKKAQARRSKLYYVRDKAVKDIRRKMKAQVVRKVRSGTTTAEVAETEITPEE
ncbi:MAG: 50S ribosomal protein L19 [Minisyncoccia bacterium]